ncbi:MAG: hypothetical protein M0R46_01030 [Candidatus Muirbacterium halophilum]|nr:hypothetical protein [Candidatus Muirbacterium halophilum]MCK9474478.1 hypothetical protein [Candidatus Muirbacterium halophilum]
MIFNPKISMIYSLRKLDKKIEKARKVGDKEKVKELKIEKAKIKKSYDLILKSKVLKWLI